MKIDRQKMPMYTPIMLEDAFRKHLLEEAINKAGSLRELGRVMGYTGNASNWNVKQILYGQQGIPLFRLERLCKFMNISLTNIEKHIREVKTRKC